MEFGHPAFVGPDRPDCVPSADQRLIHEPAAYRLRTECVHKGRRSSRSQGFPMANEFGAPASFTGVYDSTGGGPRAPASFTGVYDSTGSGPGVISSFPGTSVSTNVFGLLSSWPGHPHSHAHARRERSESCHGAGAATLRRGLRRRAAGVPPRTPLPRQFGPRRLPQAC
jgi:hypothetical protein